MLYSCLRDDFRWQILFNYSLWFLDLGIIFHFGQLSGREFCSVVLPAVLTYICTYRVQVRRYTQIDKQKTKNRHKWLSN